jgi:hypothetical protein
MFDHTLPESRLFVGRRPIDSHDLRPRATARHLFRGRGRSCQTKMLRGGVTHRAARLAPLKGRLMHRHLAWSYRFCSSRKNAEEAIDWDDAAPSAIGVAEDQCPPSFDGGVRPSVTHGRGPLSAVCRRVKIAYRETTLQGGII